MFELGIKELNLKNLSFCKANKIHLVLLKLSNKLCNFLIK